MDYNERTIKAKIKVAQHRRSISGREVDEHDGRGDRLPPGQHIVNNWPVLDLGCKPAVILEDWMLSVDGLIDNPLMWTWKDFLAQPQCVSVSDFHCVTSWSQLDNAWEGVRFQHLFACVKPEPSAKFLLFTACDHYTTNLPLEACDEEDVLLAAKWNGKSLPQDHGGPVRLIVPKRYAWKGAKWLKRITFLQKDQKGFWEVRGYSNTAFPWVNDRYG